VRRPLAAAVDLVIATGLAALPAAGQPPSPGEERIDLPAVLRLAGAQSLDIEAARQRLEEARAAHRSAVQAFAPWLSPGFVYRRHDGLTQETAGGIVDVHKHSKLLGGALAAQVDLGPSLFRARESRHRVEAASGGLAARRADALLAAVSAYYDLARAQGAVDVARQAPAASRDYEAQIGRAVEIGLALRGDALRVAAQIRRYELSLRQAAEARRAQAARLAELLHLDAVKDLYATEADLAPVAPADATATEALVARALAARPEVRRAEAEVAASEAARKGVLYGPLLPALGAQAFVGGLDGGRRGAPGELGASRDYVLGLQWRIGPGGLLDAGAAGAARARLAAARVELERVRAAVAREVVEAAERARSLSEQIDLARAAVSAAEEALRLAEQRREFGVAAVLERILAQQDLARARNDYVVALAERHKAEYALARAAARWPAAESGQTGRERGQRPSRGDRAPRPVEDQSSPY
jgi:outer membrane protein TolC